VLQRSVVAKPTKRKANTRNVTPLNTKERNSPNSSETEEIQAQQELRGTEKVNEQAKPAIKTLYSDRLHLAALVNRAVATGHELTTHGLRYGKRGLEVHCTVSTAKGAAELLSHAPHKRSFAHAPIGRRNITKLRQEARCVAPKPPIRFHSQRHKLVACT
jgi:hypothetical protein